MVSSWLERVFACVDMDEARQLALDLCRIPSPTGDEERLGEFIVEWFRNHELVGIRQEVEAGRANAIGIVRGQGGGPSLMLNGHMDVAVVYRHEEMTGLVPPRKPIIEPHEENGILYGTGMDNMKSGLAAIMSAARAIKKSGVPLRGDLIIVGVIGEVSRAPVDQYQGHHYRSEGTGTRYLLAHGIVSDYAIVADTSHFGLTWGQCGVVYAKITTPGRPAYTPFTRRSADPRKSDNAVIKMTLLIDAFERWAADYEQKHIYRFDAGEIHPKAVIGAIAGGVPFRVANSLGTCSIYVDIRTPPGKRPTEVQRELRAALDSAGVDYELELFGSQMGYEGKGVKPVVEAVRDAHQLVIGKPLPPIDPVENSMWTDTNLYNEIGIPAVKFGIGTVLRSEKGGGLYSLHNRAMIPNSTSMEDLINATKIYAAAGLQICGIAE